MSIDERYKIEDTLISGMSGVTYSAVDKTMGRLVAFRRLFPEIPHARCREVQPIFDQVFGNLSKMRSPGLIKVVDGGLDEQGYYLVTELLDGPLLGERLMKDPLKVDEFSELAKSLLSTISEFHSHNIFHTALSSKSVQLTSDPVKGVRFKIIDLGLAALIRSLDPKRRARHYGMIEPVLMPPEYFEGKLPSQSLDLYSCGQLLYASLAGGHPLGELGIDMTYRRLKQGSYPPVHAYRKDVPEEVGEWIQKMTAFSPKDRFPKVQDALEAFPEPKPVSNIKLVRTTRRVMVAAKNTTGVYGVMGGAPLRTGPTYIQNRVPLLGRRGELILIGVLILLVFGMGGSIIYLLVRQAG